ncbi:MAG TPA: glycosyltransferase family 4 protein [Propionibacteriaceae bacterium]|nr:glycosyltransferase family 4 protein [Propionibacteriaceae bacterium]
MAGISRPLSAVLTVPSTLIITNDFPPRVGGIESFVSEVCELLDHDVVVYASGSSDAAASDRDRPYPVIRDAPLLLPGPRLAVRAAALLRAVGATRVIFGAAAPLGLLAPSLRWAGAGRILGLTHGHETWWSQVPAGRQLLRRIGDSCDHLTAISSFTERCVASALSPTARRRMLRLAPPVDTERFRPPEGAGRSSVARCVAVARLIPQKGVSTLLRAWRMVIDSSTRSGDGRELIIVGDGPLRARLERTIAELKLSDCARIIGALPRAGVVTQLQQASVFALPVRTQWAGLNPEGLGLAALEAAACGLPVVVGNSGGAPETVKDGETGFVVPSHDHQQFAERLGLLLSNPHLAQQMGARGRRFVCRHFSTESARATLREALDL